MRFMKKALPWIYPGNDESMSAFWAAISKGASYQGRQNLKAKGDSSPPLPDFGQIRQKQFL
jgi:hypothetical protein